MHVNTNKAALICVKTHYLSTFLCRVLMFALHVFVVLQERVRSRLGGAAFFIHNLYLFPCLHSLRGLSLQCIYNADRRQLWERRWPRPVRGRGTDRQTERERAAECICVPMASWGRVQPSRSAIACSSFNFACWRRPSSLKILSFNHW